MITDQQCQLTNLNLKFREPVRRIIEQNKGASR